MVHTYKPILVEHGVIYRHSVIDFLRLNLYGHKLDGFFLT